MKLKDKAASIGFDDLDAPPAPAPATEVASGTPQAKARSGVAAISQSISMRHQVQDLEAKLAQFEDAKVIVMLDPREVRPSRWKNRHDASFTTKAFADLKTEIESAGRNVQAIKVRQIKGEGAFKYEIVYGRRRHRACLELGLPVAAVVESMSDVELFKEMDRENRQRADLSPWEQGMMYRDALDQGLFSSLRQLASGLGLDPGNVSKALKLAALPEYVVDAFGSPLELQYRWAADLNTAIEKDADRVRNEAGRISKETPRPASRQVLSRLLGFESKSVSVSNARDFKQAGKVVGTWTSDGQGGATLKIRPGTLSEAKEKRILDALEKIFG